MTGKKINYKQVSVISEALYNLPMGSHRYNALKALVELADMLKDCEKEVRRLDHRNTIRDEIASGG